MKHSAFDDFSESTQEILNFTRCQRPDGSFYGTSGQCRKGAPVDVKEQDAKKGGSGGGGDKERFNKMSTADATKLSKDLNRQIGEAAKAGDVKLTDSLMKAKGDVDATIKARGEGKSKLSSKEAATRTAQSARRAAVVQALEKEKLPTNPPALQRAVNKDLKNPKPYQNLKGDEKWKKGQVREARDELRARRDDLSRAMKSKEGPPSFRRAEVSFRQTAYNRAQRELNRRGTELNKVQGRMTKMRNSRQKRIEANVARVAARAAQQARDRQAKTGRNIMGVDERVGDQPIKP